MKCKCYKDYLNAEINRVSSSTPEAESYKNIYRHAKKIKRAGMLDLPTIQEYN